MIIFIALVISTICVYNFGTELNKYVEADQENKAVIEADSADGFDGEIGTLFVLNPFKRSWKYFEWLFIGSDKTSFEKSCNNSVKDSFFQSTS